MSQLFLDLNPPLNFSASDVIISECNQLVINHLDAWPAWSSGLLGNLAIIQGPKGSGKTTLAKYWQTRSQAVFLKPEEVESLPSNIAQNIILDNLKDFLLYPENLFHLINMVQDSSYFMLITSSSKISQQGVMLPDLESRLKAIPTFPIYLPDLNMIEMVLMKEFSNRQLKIGFELIKFISNRIERSFARALEVVEQIDSHCRSYKCKVSYSVIKQFL